MAENLPFNPQVFRTSNDRPMPIAPPSTADLTSMPVLKHSQSEPQARRAPSTHLQGNSNKNPGWERNTSPTTRRRNATSIPNPGFVDPSPSCNISVAQRAHLNRSKQPERWVNTKFEEQERRQTVPEDVSSEHSDATVRRIPLIRVTSPSSTQSTRLGPFPALSVTTSTQAPPTAETASPPSRLDGAEEEEYTSIYNKADEFCKTLKKIPSKLSLMWRQRSKANDNNEPPVAPESGSSVPKTKTPLWSMSSKRFKRGSRNRRTPLLSSDGGQNTSNCGLVDQTNSSSQQTTDPVSEPSSNSEQQPPQLPPRRPITPQPANPLDASSGLETFGAHPQDPITQADLDETERQAAVEESQRTFREARIQNLGSRSYAELDEVERQIKAQNEEFLRRIAQIRELCERVNRG
ncbi:MAG: hypothetical protein Q9214_005101 [Letrouitia sp. 1 TL-2023]